MRTVNKETMIFPIKVLGQRVWRTYVGGKKLDEFEGIEPAKDSHKPELWILSTVEAKNFGRDEIEEGKCYLSSDNSLSLAKLIEEYPEEALGIKHNKKYKGEMGVLVKLIDSKERLTIQVHPTKEKAKQYFQSDYGKTESWHIIETRDDMLTNPCIYLGFKEHVTKDLFMKYFEEQDLAGMLDSLHCIPVQKGDTFIIPGGIPHAIGAGCTLIEIQEPTDITLRVEKVTPSGYEIDEETCHRGIGVEAMMDNFDFKGMTEEEVLNLCMLKNEEIVFEGFSKKMLISYDDTEFFQMEKITIKDEILFNPEESFYGLFVLSGKGEIELKDNVKEFDKKVSMMNQFFISPNCHPFKIKSVDEPIVIMKFKGPK